MTRRDLLPLFAAGLVQNPPEGPTIAEPPLPEWICPMDKDVRNPRPGTCPRCGMKLVIGVPDPVEFPLLVTVEPPAWKPGSPITLKFEILDPKSKTRVKRLQLVHEKLFHLFLISQDLEYFAHEHPDLRGDGTFVFRTTLPKRGLYRLLGDFYPEAGTPQLAVKTIASAWAKPIPAPTLNPDLEPKHAENLRIALRSDPEKPIAGLKTMLFFGLTPSDRLEPYLGAWGHLLVASADLIDLIHTHPFLADGGPEPQFNIVFPRPGMYRIWAQFQRAGIVNTVSFTIEAKSL